MLNRCRKMVRLSSMSFFNKSSTVASCPFLEAMKSGLVPSLLHVFIAAPFLSKSCAMLSCPFWQARKSGLHLSLSKASTSTPASSKCLTVVSFPS